MLGRAFLAVMLAVTSLFLATSCARADAILYNFIAPFVNTDISRRVSIHDVSGNGVDAHSGNILQVGGTFYKYGEHHGGGFRWQTGNSAPDGFNVYQSTDLTNQKRLGYILDPVSAWAISYCQPPLGTVGSGCFRPTTQVDNTNSNYAFFFIALNGSSTIPSGIAYMACTSPFDGSTCSTPAAVSIPTTEAGDVNAFTDASNNMYLVYSVLSSRDIHICQLNTARTSCGTDMLVVSNGGEGVWGFIRASTGKVYIGFGSLCAYCINGGTTLYAMASTPLGTYGTPIQIDTSNTCNSQSMEVNVIVAGGQTTYLFMADSWTGLQNQGWANQYYYPLSFTGDAINTMTCAQTVTVPGVPSAGTYPTPNNYPNYVVDQRTYTNYGVFTDRCYVSNTIWEMQTFIPAQASLYGIGLPLAINQPFGSGASGAANPGTLQIDIDNVDGNNNPTTTIATQTIAPNTLPWASQWKTIVFNTTLTPGTKYAIVLHGQSDVTTGCFTNAISQFTNEYPSGVHRNSTNSGGTWATNTNFSMMFATYSAAGALPPMGGLAANDNGLQWGERRRVAR